MERPSWIQMPITLEVHAKTCRHDWHGTPWRRQSTHAAVAVRHTVRPTCGPRIKNTKSPWRIAARQRRPGSCNRDREAWPLTESLSAGPCSSRSMALVLARQWPRAARKSVVPAQASNSKPSMIAAVGRNLLARPLVSDP